METTVEKVAESVIPVSEGSNFSSDYLPVNLQDSYRYFLSLCDGGYTHDKFLHFFGLQGPPEHNLIYWNESNLWKQYYDLDDKTFIFAEDLLGTQFCFDVRGDRKVVKMLIPGSGKMSLHSNTFEEFLADEVLDCSGCIESRQIVDKFFTVNAGSFRPFTHISYKIPVRLGGNATDISNMEILRNSTNLKILGQIIKQTKNVPPGTNIRDIEIDYKKEKITLIF